MCSSRYAMWLYESAVSRMQHVCPCCRHAANSRKGYDKDAKKDKEKAFMLLQQMCA